MFCPPHIQDKSSHKRSTAQIITYDFTQMIERHSYPSLPINGTLLHFKSNKQTLWSIKNPTVFYKYKSRLYLLYGQTQWYTMTISLLIIFHWLQHLPKQSHWLFLRIILALLEVIYWHKNNTHWISMFL